MFGFVRITRIPWNLTPLGISIRTVGRTIHVEYGNRVIDFGVTPANIVSKNE
jgi:hypothetical protein